jgi:sialate O-acetylesterase
VGGFSAAGYFFGREIYKELKVPVGLIHSSWGGTPVESWMPITSLKGNPLYKDIVKRYAGVEKSLNVSDEKKAEARAEHTRKMKEYMASLAKSEYPNKGFEQGLAKASYDDASWKSMKIPSPWGRASKEMSGLDGVVWFRKTVTVPADWAGKELSLKVGMVDDVDVTYFNGQKVGETNEGGSSWKMQRDYTIPGKLVKAGKNTIAVRVTDIGGGGGIWSGTVSVSVKGASAKPISLVGAWKYKITVPVRPLRKPSNPFNINGWTPSGLYNGMIYPLAPYAIQGAIWYQGESNTRGPGRPEQYAFLFPQMIRDWRSLWQDDELSFFYVELANHMGRAAQPGTKSTWALLRESQRKALELPRTGMGTAIDIGEANDIHPRNKQDVGKRLALSALAVEYGKKIVHKGPLMKGYTGSTDPTKHGTVKLVFTDVADGLKANTPLEKCFGVKAADGQWTWAEAKIVGKNEVVLKGKAGTKIVAVNYAWANNPAAPLYNSAGIPAVPFNTESQE